jgi:hypothetical protein
MPWAQHTIAQAHSGTRLSHTQDSGTVCGRSQRPQGLHGSQSFLFSGASHSGHGRFMMNPEAGCGCFALSHSTQPSGGSMNSRSWE